MIDIKTKIHDGINKASGGGEIKTHYSFRTTPKKLLFAYSLLKKHTKTMTRSFGNVGHCGSWITINDVPINDEDFVSIEFAKNRKIAMDAAEKLINSVKSGSLLKYRQDCEKTGWEI